VNILITGGAGYIGSQLLRALAEDTQVDRVRILDNMQDEKFQSLMNLPGGHHYDFVLGDVRNEDDVRRAVGDDTDTVIHLAALTNATLSFDRRDDTELTNYVGTQNVVRAVQQAPLRDQADLRLHNKCIRPHQRYRKRGESRATRPARMASSSSRVSATRLRSPS
jgi:nucleoside-diphosphate-sugar epimerase